MKTVLISIICAVCISGSAANNDNLPKWLHLECLDFRVELFGSKSIERLVSARSISVTSVIGRSEWKEVALSRDGKLGSTLAEGGIKLESSQSRQIRIVAASSIVNIRSESGQLQGDAAGIALHPGDVVIMTLKHDY